MPSKIKKAYSNMEMILIFISQLSLIFFKHLNIRAIAKERIGLSVAITGAVQGSWIIGSALAIRGYDNQDYILVAIYILGGMVGTYLNYKIKI